MNFKLNKLYNFTTIAPEILGGSYTNMKVVGIVTSEEARKFRDIYTLHEQMKRSLDQDLSVTDLTYIVFESGNRKEVFALEYIMLQSIVEVKKIKIVIEIPDANTEDIAILQEKLTELGYYNCKIRQSIG